MQCSKSNQSLMDIEGKNLTMEVDTGAAVSAISENTYKLFFKHIKPQKSTLILRTYPREPLQILGEIQVQVKYDELSARIPLTLWPQGMDQVYSWEIG